jgi:succinate dehydrogenase / fumarate reductase cytochrome b subunit
MSEPASKPRPQFRNLAPSQILFSYKLPLAAKLSILHRASGALLFVCLPLLIVPLFAASVSSPQSYAAIAGWTSNIIVKLIILALIWGYLHHFCAGIRYLVLDLHIGVDKESAKRSAGVAFGISLALTVVFGLKLFGVW